MKNATINIYKSLVLADIDAETYKRADGLLAAESDQLKNAVSSDSSESLDQNLLHRYMEIRDAKLRYCLSFALKAEEEESLAVDNILEKDKESFEYAIQVPDTFTRAKVMALAKQIHSYLVQGTISDWYAVHNMKGNVSAEDLEAMETSIVCSLRCGFAKKPLQPFGPRN